MTQLKGIAKESVTPVVTIINAIQENPKPAHSNDKLARFIEEESKMVKGRFRCFENPGSSARIQIRKYKGIPMFDKWMWDGEAYDVPLYVARHLNGIDATATHINGKVNSCSYPIHGFLSVDNNLVQGQDSMIEGGATVVPKENIVKRVRRYGFESLEFSVE